MSTYQLLLKLKTQLISIETGGILDNDETWITPEDLLKIRKVLKHLKPKYKNLPEIRFITDYADLQSMCIYFRNVYEEYGGTFFSNLISFVDPWLNHLIENDYEVKIRQITDSENFGNFHGGIIHDLEELENAYQQGNYSHIDSLSSKILATLFKGICDLKEIEYSNSDSHQKLYEKVKVLMKLNPGMYQDENKKLLRDFCSHLDVIITRLNNLRNLYSDGHGTSNDSYIAIQSLSKHHFKLIVDTTKTIANFILDSFIFQNSEKKRIEF